MARGPVIFYDMDCQEGVDSAKDYCKRHGLTPDDVKISRSGGGIIVTALRDVSEKIKGKAPL